MAFLSDRYTRIAKELLQEGVQLGYFLGRSKQAGVLLPAEAAALEVTSGNDRLRGWRETLIRLAGKNRPELALNVLQILIEQDESTKASLSPTLQHLRSLWIEGMQRVALFINTHQYEVQYLEENSTIQELPKSHVANVTYLKKVMQGLGFTIEDVDMAISTPLEQRKKELEELVLKIREAAEIFVCISGVVTQVQVESNSCGLILYNNAVIQVGSPDFKPVGMSIPGIYRILSTFPRSSVTLYIDCMPFQIPHKSQTSIWEPLFGPNYLRTGNSRYQIVCGFLTTYHCDFEQYMAAKVGPRAQHLAPWLAFTEGTFSYNMKLFGHCLEGWSARGRPRVTSREMHETLLCQFAEEVEYTTPFHLPSLVLMGHKDKKLLSPDVIPLQYWYYCRTIQPSQLQSGDTLLVKLDTSKLFKLVKGCSVVVYHPLQPEVKVQATVQNELGPFCCEVVLVADKGMQDTFRRLKELVQSSKKFPGQSLCLCPIINPRFKVAISKTAREQKRPEVDQLEAYIQNQSCMLECVVKDIDTRAHHFLVDYDKLQNCFVVNDLHYALMNFMEQSVLEISRILEQCAHFHLGMEISQSHRPKYKYQATITHHDNELLTPPQSTGSTGSKVGYKMSASSEKGAENIASHGVWQPDTDTATWKPRLVRDKDQFLQCDTECNVTVTSIVVKGDPSTEERVTKLQLVYARFVKKPDQLRLTREQPSTTLHLSSADLNGHRLTHAPVRRIELQPTEWAAPYIRLSIVLLKSKNDPVSKIQVIGAEQLMVEPEKARRTAELQGGLLMLVAAPDKPHHKIILDFEKEIELAQIELTAEFSQSGSDALRASIHYYSEYSRVDLNDTDSLWKSQIHLLEPLTACRFRFQPKEFQKGIALQMQLYGSPVCSTGNPLVAKNEDRLELSLAVSKGGSQPVNFYVIVFEFTGSVSMVVNECVFPGTQTKKILRVFIPRGVPDTVHSILDTYRVFTSTKVLNLQYLLQQGPVDYYKGGSAPPYFPFGSNVEVQPDEWDVVDLPVRIERS